MMPAETAPTELRVHVAADAALPDQGPPRFPIGSVTKLLTALLVLELHDEGRLDLDAPIGEPGAEPVTARALLAHRGRQPFELRPEHWETLALDRKALARARSHPDRIDIPPLTWHYSNLGYALLGAEVEAAAGVPFEAALHARILTPLDMGATSLPTPDEAPRVLGAAAPAGELWSTAADLHRLARALEERMATPRGRRTATRLLELATPLAADRLAGPGFELRRADGHWVFTTRGTIGSASCSLVVWPRRGASVLVSRDGTPSDDLTVHGIDRWRRGDSRTRDWWLDGGRVAELTSGDDVDLVIEESLWPVPLFTGVRTGDRLVGRSWSGEPAEYVLADGRLAGDQLTLAADASESAHGTGR